MTATPDTVVRSLPHFIVRGQSNTLALRMQRTDAVVLPDEVLVSVWSPAGSLGSPDIVSEQAASALVDGSGYSYTIAGGSLPDTLSLSDLWVVRWTVTIGSVVDYAQEAAHLCRSMIRPVVTVDEVARRYHDTRLWLKTQNGPARIQDQIDNAWVDIVRRLMAQGRLPWRILDPFALGEPHRERTLELIANEFYGNANGDQWAEIAERHRGNYERAMAGMIITYDSNDDASPSREEAGSGGEAVIMTGGGPRYPYGPARHGRGRY